MGDHDNGLTHSFPTEGAPKHGRFVRKLYGLSLWIIDSEILCFEHRAGGDLSAISHVAGPVEFGTGSSSPRVSTRAVNSYSSGHGRVLAKKALRLRTGRQRHFGKASGPGFILGWVYLGCGFPCRFETLAFEPCAFRAPRPISHRLYIFVAS